MRIFKCLLMIIAGFVFMARGSAPAGDDAAASVQSGGKEEVTQKCITLKSTGAKQCFAIRRTLAPSPSEEKNSVEVTCVSQKTGEKKSTYIYKGPGARLLSDKEICMKQFGEDFTDTASKTDAVT